MEAQPLALGLLPYPMSSPQALFGSSCFYVDIHSCRLGGRKVFRWLFTRWER